MDLQSQWIKKKCLVVVTKNFGENFTGATKATQELVKRWRNQFTKVIVITKNVGVYDQQNVEILHYKNLHEIYFHLQHIKNEYEEVIGYSDDHFGWLFKVSKISYFHTYHGNWPEAKKISVMMFLKSLYFIPLYKLTIKFADFIVNVSYFMDKYTRKYNDNTIVIRNGINDRNKSLIETKCNNAKKNVRIIMVGNIDQRKYKLALKLFAKLKEEDKVSVDIYGRIEDGKLAARLKDFPFVSLIGYKQNIAYEDYDVMLNCSLMENLPISICEAVKMNLPVVAFNVGGISEIIRNGVNGFIISEKKMDHFPVIIRSIREGYQFSYDNHLGEYDWDLSAQLYMRNVWLNFR